MAFDVEINVLNKMQLSLKTEKMLLITVSVDAFQLRDWFLRKRKRICERHGSWEVERFQTVEGDFFFFKELLKGQTEKYF